MITYRDRCFCWVRDCKLTNCNRHAEQVKANTEKLPVEWVDFSDNCPAYERNDEQ